jgi:hypothetical protein
MALKFINIGKNVGTYVLTNLYFTLISFLLYEDQGDRSPHCLLQVVTERINNCLPPYHNNT